MIWETWKCFKDVYPRNECGVVIKIEPKNDRGPSEYDVKDHLFYGYVFPNSDYIYLIRDLSNFCSMGWKVLKDYDVDEIYWLYDSTFLPDSIREKNKQQLEAAGKALSEYGKFVKINER